MIPAAATTPLATAVPPNTGDGYVAAAYIVFVAILLIYFAIMALRLTRVERSLRELRAREQEGTPLAPRTESPATAPGSPEAPAREREPV